MKPFKLFLLIAALTLGAAQQAKAQSTTLYTNSISSAADVSTWTLSGVTWSSSNSGQVIFANPSSYATTPAIIPAGATNLSLTIKARYGDYITLYTSPNGSAWATQGAFSGSSSVANATKALPNGTRYLKFQAMPGTANDVYLISVEITGVDPCDPVITGVTLNKSTATVGTNSTETLTATMQPSCNATNVTWSSSNTAVASVSSSGVVTGIAPGTATITATTVSGGFTAQCEVTVKTIAATGISLPSQMSVVSGNTNFLIASVLPAQASNKAVTWKSDNTAVATVSNDGLVTGFAPGTATITATSDDGGFTAQCEVTVTEPDEDFEMTFYENDFSASSSVSGWTLSGDAEWGKDGYGNGALLFRANGGTATSPAIIPANATHLKITTRQGWGASIDFFTSPNATTWTQQGTLEVGNNSTQSITKTLPDGARYIRFVADRNTFPFIVHIKITMTVKVPAIPSLPPCNETLDTTPAAAFAGGSGAQNDPYLISSRAELAYLAKLTNAGQPTSGKYYKLTQNINLNGRCSPWTPIGSSRLKPFRGHFDGAGYEIQNLFIDSINLIDDPDASFPSGRIGLFGSTNSATIRNVSIGKGSQVYSHAITSYYEYIYVGGIVGQADSTQIIGCRSYATISSSTTSGSNNRRYVGGIVGNANNSNKIVGCSNFGSIANGTRSGGIAGQLAGSTIQRSYNKGHVNGSSANGIAGENYGGDVYNSYNRGIVTGGTVSGIFDGSYDGDTIKNVYSAGDVIGTSFADLIYGNQYNNRAIIQNAYRWSSAQRIAPTVNAINAKGTAFAAPDAALVSNLNGTPSSYIWAADTKNENDGFPVFNTNTTNIHFITNGGVALNPLPALQYLTLGDIELPVPVREGATFEGWYTNLELTAKPNLSALIGDVEKHLYAKWQITVTFNANRGAISPATKEYAADKPYGSFPTPTRAGYTFKGWATDETLKTSALASDMASASTTLYARWEVTVKFNTDGGEPLAPKNYVGGLEFDFDANEGLPTPTKAGYVFGAWYAEPRYDNPRTGSSIVPLDRTDTLYAEWGAALTVLFDPQNGDAPTYREFFPRRAYNATFTADGTPCNTGFPANPSKTDALFLGWYTDPADPSAAQLTPADPVDENIGALYARWNHKLSVSFETNGGNTIAPRSYFPGYAYSYAGGGVSNPGLPATPTKDGALFLGWYDTPDFSSSYKTENASTVSAEVGTLYARWSEKITVSFETNGGNSITAKELYFGYAYNSTQNGNYTLQVPNKADAKFMGWYETSDFSGSAIASTALVNQNVPTLFAKWSEKMTVSFEENGGSTIADKEFYFGYAYYSPQNGNYALQVPNKADAKFMGWYESSDFSGEALVSTALVDQNVPTLFAKWSEKMTVSFEENGGSTIADKELYFGFAYYSSQNGGYVLQVPNKADAKFMGWYETSDFSGTAVVSTALVDQSVPTLYAKWSEKVTVSFEENGGSTVADKAGLYFGYAYNNTNNGYTLPTPNKTNAKFMGWYDTPDFSEAQVTSSSLVDQNKTTLYAKWSEGISVAFELNNGGSIAAKTYYPEFTFNNSGQGNTSLPAAPAKDSAYFVGWYDTPDFSGDIITNTSYVSSSMSKLYARWAEKVNVVFIDYAQDKVQSKSFWHDLPYSYNRDGKNTGMPAATSPSSPNVTWYHDIVGLEDKLEDATLVPNRHTTLFARWCVEVRFEVNGGEAIADKIYTPKLRYNEAPNEGLPAATRSGYVFEGWHSDAALTQPVSDELLVPDSSYTLYAKWKVITTPVTSVSLNKTATTLTEGDEEQLTATVAPSNATNQNVTWSSDNNAIATVSAAGLVTAVTKGTATITVKTIDGNKTATCTVTVNAAVVTPPPTPKYTVTISATTNGKISVKNGTTTVTSGTQLDSGTVLTLTATPNSSYKFTKWWDNSTESSRSYTLKSNANISATFTAVAVESVGLNKATTSILVGGTEQLSPTVQPANALNKNVTWSSSNTSVATVSNAGLVTAVTVGSATITVKTADGNKTATCTVTVSATAVSVTSVTLNKPATTLTAGDEEQLTATVAPSNATNQNVTWSSDNNAVATVSNTGLVTAVTKGTATITVKTADGNKTATCTVTVKAAVVTPPPTPKYTVNITTDTNGSISVKNGTATVTSGTQLDSGTVLTLTATPNSSYKFTKWWDNSTEASRSYTLKSNVSITATFTAETTDPDPEDPKPTAVAANELLPLKLYPTVTNGELIVENGEWDASKAMSQIEIYSLNGTLMLTQPTAGEKTTVNISRLPSGTYIVKVGKYAGKVVKK